MVDPKTTPLTTTEINDALPRVPGNPNSIILLHVFVPIRQRTIPKP